MFLNVSTQQLLLSMEGTKNCLYWTESSKYDTAVKKRHSLTQFSSIIIKINAFIASIFFVKSTLQRQLPFFIHMPAGVVT